MMASVLSQPRLAPILAAVALTSLAAVAPAAAQDPYAPHQLGVLEAQQQMDRFRAIAQQNELNALAGEVQTERALDSLRLQRGSLLTGPAAPLWSTPTPGAGPGEVAGITIPSDRLADSNAKIKAILARNGR